MAGELKWNGAMFRRMTERQVEAGLRAMGAEVATLATVRASKPFPPASKPGESPHFRTPGGGADHIAHNFDRKSKKARIGYRGGAMHMVFHELGINYSRAGFQQRPTIVPTFDEHIERIIFVGQEAAKAAVAGGSR